MIIEELSRADCAALLARNPIAHLACASGDQPYIVPIYVAYDASEDCLYGFSTLGRKIDFLRTNPRSCVEVDEVGAANDRWTSVVVTGRFEELTDNSEHAAARTRAYDLLKRHASWWVPAYLRTRSGNDDTHTLEPIYFRITIEEMSGRRAQRAA
jgi:uncharacterized protein